MEDNGFELKNGCLQVKGLTEDEYVEGVTTNDDIYPRNLIKTSNVTYYEKDVEDESTPEEGDYIKRTFYRVKGLTIVDADGNKTGTWLSEVPTSSVERPCILSSKVVR